jgi:hypothetical protein
MATIPNSRSYSPTDIRILVFIILVVAFLKLYLDAVLVIIGGLGGGGPGGGGVGGIGGGGSIGGSGGAGGFGGSNDFS